MVVDRLDHIIRKLRTADKEGNTMTPMQPYERNTVTYLH